jgi:hypothetical protein
VPGIYRRFIHQTDERLKGIPVPHTVRSKAYHRCSMPPWPHLFG